ncbi:MAG: hypothetical protein JST06_03535 [Bacteroidetes bacterium]|nr:hypothetical protein [Bacteroidota bacterium]
MSRFRLLIFLWVLLLGPVATQAQNHVDVSASLRTNDSKLLVGDQARVFLSAQCDLAKSHIQWPQIPDSFGKLEVIRKDKIDTSRKGSLVVYSQRFLVSGWDSLDAFIPAFHIQVLPVSGNPFFIQTDSLLLQVRTVPVDTTQAFKGLKGIMHVTLNWRDYIGWILAGAVLLLALIGFIIWRKTRKKPQVIIPPPPPEPIHEKALRLLANLETEGLWQRGEVKEYYICLTDILRNYVEARFNIPALERTTDELTAAAGKHSELCLQVQRLHGILATADMAKFARAQPTAAEHVAAMQDTKDLILASIPKAQPDSTLSQPGSNPQPSGQNS